jgi:hypothetical protein
VPKKRAKRGIRVYGSSNKHRSRSVCFRRPVSQIENGTSNRFQLVVKSSEVSNRVVRCSKGTFVISQVPGPFLQFRDLSGAFLRKPLNRIPRMASL